VLTEKQIMIAASMFQLRDSMKRLYAAEWQKKIVPFRGMIIEEMERTGNSNPLSAVIPIAKEMSAKGHNPALLMAVAVEIADE